MGQLEDVQVFLRVVDAGGISRAADQLNIAKSAVSRRLSDLETRLKTKLIQRTTRRFHLTEEGRKYYQKAQEVVASFDALDQSVLQESDNLEGRLSISIPLSFGVLHMYQAIDAFLQLHPDIELKVNLDDSEVNMVEEGIDVAFRIGELGDSSLQARKILPVDIIMSAAPAYIEKFNAIKTLDDLSLMRFLRYSAEPGSNYKVYDSEGEQHLIPIKGDLYSNNGDFLMQMAVAGHGIVVLPRFICWQAINNGDLVPLLPEFKFETLNGYAVYPQNRYLSRNARAFIDFLVDFYKKDNSWDL